MITFNEKAMFFAVFFLGISLFPLAVSSETFNGLKLSLSQHQSMGMETDVAKQTSLIPSAILPAQATIPLKTIRNISSPLSGEIIKLNFVHGPVKKGEVIAEIESPELLKKQEIYLATLQDLKISQQNLNRARQLNKSGISSNKVLQQASSEVKKLTLNKSQHEKNLTLLGMAQASIANIEATQEFQPAIIEIKSPIDGQLFGLQAKLGERVSENQSLISVGAINPIILVVRVPVASANEIEEGQKAELVSIPRTDQRTGVVKHIDPMVDPMTQSVDIHIGMQNDDNKLRSGQLFKIRFLTATNEKVYQISANAISQYDQQTVVFIQDNEYIQVLPIEVINITNKTLYFKVVTQHPEPLVIYTKGTTAIKSAMDSINEPEEG